VNGILFLARGSDIALARFSPIELELDVRLAKLKTRRASIHNNAYGAPVRFPKGGYFKELSE
jgi:hypothetical protein